MSRGLSTGFTPGPRTMNSVYRDTLKNSASSLVGGSEIGYIIGGIEPAKITLHQTSDIVEKGFSAENATHMPQEAYLYTYSSLFGIFNTLFVHTAYVGALKP